MNNEDRIQRILQFFFRIIWRVIYEIYWASEISYESVYGYPRERGKDG